MNKQNIVPIGVIVAILLWVRGKKKMFDSTRFSIYGVKVDGTILNPELIIKIAAKNTTDASQAIENIYGEVYLNDTILIGEVLQTNRQQIDANATSIIELPVAVRLSGLLNTISTLIQNKSGKFTFKGIVNIYGINIPVNESYKL